MSPLRVLGWTLLAAALLAAAAEWGAVSVKNEWGLRAASDVLRVIFPRALEALERAVDPFVWHYIVTPLLSLPGWLLLGAPGAVLVWLGRSPEEPLDPFEEVLPMATYEDIVAAAREADEDDIGLPSKYRDLDEYDPAKPQNSENAEAADGSDELERADIVPSSRFIVLPTNNGGDPPKG